VFDFRPSQGQHPNGFHPASEAVSDARQGQHIGRAGQQETARAIIFVDRLLDRQQQIGRALDLVDDGAIQTSDEPGRVGLGGLKDGLVVECAVGPAGFSHLSHQRRLAGPARSDDEDDRRVCKRLLRPPLNESLEHDISDYRLIGIISLGRFVVNGPLIGIVSIPRI
jgi:hypothetical protein